jgi:APA family basic amino acid/polyamine antiporter
LSAITKPKAQGSLSRILGLGFGVAVIFGGTVGVGILRLPGEIAARLGSAKLVLLVWALGAVYSMLGAISISELGAAMPQAGGFYVYARRAFGPGAGFVMGWSDWINNCASMAFVSVAASEYLLALLGQHDAQALIPQAAVALGLLALFGAVQWFGLRLSSTVQKVTSSVTAVTFLVLVVACLLHKRVNVPVAATVNAVPGNGGTLGMIAALVAVLPAIVVAYDGWYEAIYFTEEDTNPAKHLPRAMIGGVLLITSLYLVMNLGFLHLLSMEAIGRSNLVAADAAKIVFPAPSFLPNLSSDFITVLSLMTLLSCVNAVMLGAPRILFAVGRDGLFRGAATIGKGGTPRVALLLTLAMTAVLVLSGRIDEIIGIAAITVAATYAVNYLAVILLRWREPKMVRPFRAWGYPVSTVLVLLGSVAFLAVDVKADPASALRAVLLIGLALPVYWWRGRRIRQDEFQS